MKLGALVILICYWSFFTIIFSSALGSPISTNYNSTAISTMNSSGLTTSEVDTGGILGGVFGNVVGIASSGLRFFGLALFGIGLPSDTPTWVQFIFSTWQVCVSLITIGFIISLFWDG